MSTSSVKVGDSAYVGVVANLAIDRVSHDMYHIECHTDYLVCNVEGHVVGNASGPVDCTEGESSSTYGTVDDNASPIYLIVSTVSS